MGFLKMRHTAPLPRCLNHLLSELVCPQFPCCCPADDALETRKTYRAVLSEPKVVIPAGYSSPVDQGAEGTQPDVTVVTQLPPLPVLVPVPAPAVQAIPNSKKRSIDAVEPATTSLNLPTGGVVEELSKKKKRKKNKQGTVNA